MPIEKNLKFNGGNIFNILELKVKREMNYLKSAS